MSENRAIPSGWNVDSDGWLWRKSRAGDPKIKQRSDVGYDDSTFPGRPLEGRVYVREAEHAALIDKGQLP